MTVTVITGTGRSGTSFVARCFKEAGLDSGDRWYPNVRAGYEHPPVVRVNEMLMKLHPYPECDAAEKIGQQYAGEMHHALKGKEVVKDPRFSLTLDAWIHARLVDQVILCLRNPSEVEASARRIGMKRPAGSEFQRIGYLTWACARHDILVHTLLYPDVLDEGSRARSKLVAVLSAATGRNVLITDATIEAAIDPKLVKGAGK